MLILRLSVRICFENQSIIVGQQLQHLPSNAVVKIDKLFTQIDPQIGEFSFDESVARVFDDMISRSVPLYADVQQSLPVIAGLLDHDPIKVVDLGCSTGTSLIHLARALPDRNLELIGIDNSQAMLAKLREKLELLSRPSGEDASLFEQISVYEDDIRSFEFSDASIVLMNYTLQFIAAESRPDVLNRICNSLRPDGMMLVSEKVVHQQPEMDDALVSLYFDFKRRQGYSELEISRKRDALENVLVPLTVDQNLDMFRNAGFARVEVMLKWFNFATFACYRS